MLFKIDVEGDIRDELNLPGFWQTSASQQACQFCTGLASNGSRSTDEFSKLSIWSVCIGIYWIRSPK